MSEHDQAVRKRGRPRATKPLDKVGLGSFLSARISTEVREALEAEADRTGRSISQIAERWLDDARKGQADLLDILGGMALAPAIARLVDVAREVDERTENLSPSLRRLALIGAWTDAITDAVPVAIDDDIRRLHEARSEATTAVVALYQALESRARSPDDPVIARARAPLYPPIEEGLLAGCSGPPLAAELETFGEGGGTTKSAAKALAELAAAGDTCAEEVKVARAAIDRLAELEQEYDARGMKAMELGAGVAAEYAALHRGSAQ